MNLHPGFCSFISFYTSLYLETYIKVLCWKIVVGAGSYLVSWKIDLKTAGLVLLYLTPLVQAAGKTKSTDISHATVTPLVQSSFEAIFVDQMQATVSFFLSGFSLYPILKFRLLLLSRPKVGNDEFLDSWFTELKPNKFKSKLN